MTTTLQNVEDALWFELDADQKALIGALKDFLKSEVAPGAAERDASGKFPHSLVKQLGELGRDGDASA